MKLGFIGTGVITKAIVIGLIRSGLTIERISLSPRNAETSQELANLDTRIRVCASNQEVLDSSEVIGIAVVPQIVADVLGQLHFDERHHVITFVPEFTRAALLKLVQPARNLARAIPLPAVADHKGCTAIYPTDVTAKALFEAVGSVVEVESELQFDALHSVTSTMASFYAVLEHQAKWLTKHGLPYEAARMFLSGYCVGLANETTLTDKSFEEMINYLMTPGGLNQQVHAELSSSAAYSHYGRALDRLLVRVHGQA